MRVKPLRRIYLYVSIGRYKEVSLKVNSENTKRVFMYVMSIALYTLFTEQVLYILYSCSVAYIQSIQKYQTSSSVASPGFMVRDTYREFHFYSWSNMRHKFAILSAGNCFRPVKEFSQNLVSGSFLVEAL